jgi:hypothetical protein
LNFHLQYLPFPPVHLVSATVPVLVARELVQSLTVVSLLG